MNFKELIAADTKNVFLNLDEFGEWHTLAGKRLICVVDDDLTSDEVKIEIGSSGQTTSTGLYGSTIAVFVSAEDIGRLKKSSTVEFDDKRYTVDSVSEQDGMYKLILQRNGGR